MPSNHPLHYYYYCSSFDRLSQGGSAARVSWAACTSRLHRVFHAPQVSHPGVNGGLQRVCQEIAVLEKHVLQSRTVHVHACRRVLHHACGEEGWPTLGRVILA